MSDSLRPYGLQIARLLCPWDSSGRNTIFQDYRNTEDPPGDLPDPEIEPESSVSPTLAGGFFTTEPPEWSSTRGEYVLQGTFAKCVGPLLVVTLGERGSWHLEGRGPGCCPTTYQAQGNPHNRASPGQQVNRAGTE